MKKRAFLFIILAGVSWGSSGLFVSALKTLGLSSLQMTAVRAIVSSVLMSGYAFIFNRGCFKATFKQFLMYFFSGISIFCTATFYFISMQLTSVSTAVVLMYTAPVLVMIYSVLFLGEKFTKLKGISLVLMIVGCALVSGIANGFEFNLLGVLTGLMSGIAYSSYNILTKIEMKRKYNPVSANTYSFIFMAVISLVLSQPHQIIEVVAKKPSSVILMIACGICTCVLPYLFYTLSLRHLDVGTAASLSIIEPLSATVFSVIFLKEILNIYSLVGIVMIIIAVFVLGKAENKNEI